MFSIVSILLASLLLSSVPSSLAAPVGTRYVCCHPAIEKLTPFNRDLHVRDMRTRSEPPTVAHIPVVREEPHVPRSSDPAPSLPRPSRRRRRSVVFARDDAVTVPVKKDTIPEATVKRDVVPDANVKRDFIPEPQVKRDVVPEPEVKRDVVPEPEVKRDVNSEVKRDNTTAPVQHTKRNPIRLIASFKCVVLNVVVCSPANEVFFSQTRD